MYVRLYKHRDQFVVIDDVDALYADRSGVRLLKCLCRSRGGESRGLAFGCPQPGASAHPRKFATKSRVVIISNDWKTLNKNVAALQSRGHVLLFQPGAAEVHRKAGTWFDDREVYEWFAKNLHRVREPSMRHYVRAKELKAAGMDWTDVLAVKPRNPRTRLTAGLLASTAYDSTAAHEGLRAARGRVPGDVFQLPPQAQQRERDGAGTQCLTRGGRREHEGGDTRDFFFALILLTRAPCSYGPLRHLERPTRPSRVVGRESCRRGACHRRRKSRTARSASGAASGPGPARGCRRSR